MFHKCTSCGKRVKYVSYFDNQPFGYDCWNVVAKEFIEKRDKLDTAIEMNELALAYGVH